MAFLSFMLQQIDKSQASQKDARLFPPAVPNGQRNRRSTKRSGVGVRVDAIFGQKSQFCQLLTLPFFV